MLKRVLFIIGQSCISLTLFSQSTYLPLDTDEYRLIDKVESSTGAVNPYLNTSIKPYARSLSTGLLTEYSDLMRNALNSANNKIDEHNIQRAISISGEWGKPSIEGDATIRSRRPLLKHFYPTQPNFIQYGDDNNFFVLNPVIFLQAGHNNFNNKKAFNYSRGAEMRARIFNTVGIYTLLAEHNEQLPYHHAQIGQSWKAFPGFDFYSGGRNGGAYDAFMARGYIDFPIYKHFVQASFGYDKHFIGDGVRSLFLSNTGAANTFIRLRGHYGKLQYQSLFLELMADYKGSLDRSLPRKYASMQYLGIQLHQRFSIGLFESTIFNAGSTVHPTNLLPVIFYQTAQQAIAPRAQRTALGLNFKYIAGLQAQVYGQAYFQDINWKEMGNNHFQNQYATQLGFKYFNAFSIPNLDLQMEWNYIRPFTYASEDSALNNYTHYNQPLAHPSGSGFNEFIAQVYYQPITKLSINLKGVYIQKAHQTVENEGVDIFQPANTRIREMNYYGLINNMTPTWSGLYINGHAQYEIRPNIYFELGASRYQFENRYTDNTYIYGGIRMNIARTSYDWL